MNVFDFAMQMETDAEGFYRQLAEKSQVEGLQRIFSSLADDENKHYQIFEGLKAGTGPVAMAPSTALEGAQNIFAGLLERKAGLGNVVGDLEGYRYAMKLEADGARYYEDAAQREREERVRDLLLRVAEEEYKHFKIVENVFHFVNAPNQYLAWGEFSNLEDFRNFGRPVDG